MNLATDRQRDAQLQVWKLHSQQVLEGEQRLAESGSFARGDQPRGVPDVLAKPYARMAAQQRAHNARQEAGLLRRGSAAAISIRTEAAPPLASRMYRPSEADVAKLREEQAAFTEVEHATSRKNAWMALPALAPVAAVMGLEAAGAIAARFAPAVVRQGPLQLVERDPYLRVGDNWATRAGRRAHQALKERVEQKPGWDYEPNIPRAGQRPLKPDVGTPPRDPLNLDKRNYIELKPDTPTGRTAAERAAKRYQLESGQKVRKIFYNPKDFI